MRIDVYDHDVEGSDDHLGVVEIGLDELAGEGVVEQWYFLEERPSQSTSKKRKKSRKKPKPKQKRGGVRLHLRYDADPLADAVSVLWPAPRVPSEAPKFHANAFYGHAMTVRTRLAPALRAASAAGDLVLWKDASASLRAMVVAAAVASAAATNVLAWMFSVEMRRERRVTIDSRTLASRVRAETWSAGSRR